MCRSFQRSKVTGHNQLSQVFIDHMTAVIFFGLNFTLNSFCSASCRNRGLFEGGGAKSWLFGCCGETRPSVTSRGADWNWNSAVSGAGGGGGRVQCGDAGCGWKHVGGMGDLGAVQSCKR